MTIFTTTIKNTWQRNKLGVGMFMIGIILCIIGTMLSLIWKLGFAYSQKTPYVIAMIGVGIPFILTGINITLQPPKLPIYKWYYRWYKGIYTNYIEENEILIIECVVSIILIMLLFISYPDGWHYPNLYIILIPYAVCIFLLIINILFNIDTKETEIEYIRKELKESNIIIKEKEEMYRDNAAPDYTIEFTNKLKRNIDELKTIMDELKINIDSGAKDIVERTTSTANKYRSDNEQLHNDVQKFKQRIEKEKIEFKERINERIIKNLMNTLHNIDELKQYKDKNANYSERDIEKIKDDLYNILKNENIEIINPSIGDDFDDKKCCAIQTVETDKFPEKKIIDVKKIGCMFKSGKIIKYADVIVSKNKMKTDKDDKTRADNKTKIEKIRTREDMKAEYQ